MPRSVDRMRSLVILGVLTPTVAGSRSGDVEGSSVAVASLIRTSEKSDGWLMSLSANNQRNEREESG